MKPTRLGLLAVSAALLAGCTVTTPSNYEVHEAILYGAAPERVGWVYGRLAGATGNVKIGGTALELRPQVQDPLALAGTLSVNGAATLRGPATNLGQRVLVTRDLAGNTYNVQALGTVDAVYVFDGAAWAKLSDRLPAGARVSAAPRNAVTLRGAGRLTEAEADALARAVSASGPVAVAVLPENEIPDAGYRFEPNPDAYLRTGLYVQRGVAAAVTAPPSAPVLTLPSLDVRELSRGSNSTYGGQTASVTLARTADALAALYRIIGGNVIPAPTPPEVNFAQNSVVSVFLGQRPTGGYGLRLVGTRAEGSTLYVTVEATSPGAGLIVTQALTSPYIAFSVAGSYDRVVVQNSAGQTLATTN